MSYRMGLTDREYEVARLCALGHTTNTIAGALSYSPDHIKADRGQILLKTGAKNMVHAVALLIRRGVL